MSNQESEGFNRRESFRIDDTVALTIRLLNQEDLDDITENFESFRLRYCMKSHMQNQNEVRRPKLIRIRKRDPDVADYLESLETQIGLLAERLDQSSDRVDGKNEFSCPANLSATGIRFRTHLPFTPGQMLEIGMVLNTLNTQVVMLGKVTRVDDRTEETSTISIQYTLIHPEDTEVLIRHLARLQQRDLQARREEE